MYIPIDTPQGFEVMGAAFFFLLAFLADAYTTSIGLAHGLTEGNFISKWLIKKLGQSLSVFLEAVAILWGGVFLTNYGSGPAVAFYLGVGIPEAVVTFLNYRKLKAAKISLK